MRIALAMWTRSKKGYEELRNSGILCLPTPSLLKKNLSHVSVHEGLCPNIYSDFKDDKHQSKPDEKKGMIMCDELKFKTQLYWNTTSDKLVGFATESGNMVNLKDEVGSLFNNTNNDDKKIQKQTKTITNAMIRS